MSDQNIFETIDKAVSNLNIAKKMVIIMMVTVVLLQPSIMFGSNLLGEYMKDDDDKDIPRIAKLVSLVGELEKEEITIQEYVDQTRYVKSAPQYGGPGIGYYLSMMYKIISGFWMCYGIVQWIVFTRLNKKYCKFTTQQVTKNTLDDENQIKADENIFGIVDVAMKHIKKTKNMFLIITIAGIVIPQLLMLGFGLLVVGPIQGPIVEEFDSIVQQLEDGTITTASFVEQFKILKSEYTRNFGILNPGLFLIFIMLSNAIVWLVYGIKQSLVLHRWNKRYHAFKDMDDEIDKKLIGE